MILLSCVEVSNMEFSKKLKELREKRGISQQALADDIYVSRSAVAKWENGYGIPCKESQQSLCDFFNVSYDELFSESDPIIVKKNRIIFKYLVVILCLATVTVGLAVTSLVIYLNLKREKAHLIYDETPIIKVNDVETNYSLEAYKWEKHGRDYILVSNPVILPDNSTISNITSINKCDSLEIETDLSCDLKAHYYYIDEDNNIIYDKDGWSVARGEEIKDINESHIIDLNKINFDNKILLIISCDYQDLCVKYLYVIKVEDITITFDSNDGTLSPKTYQYKKGENIAKPNDPTREGYIFDGWYLGDEKYDFDSNAAKSDIKLIARWTCILEFTIIDDEVCITGLNYPDLEEINILEKYDDCFVTKITKDTFKNCTNLKKVSIPNTIKYIEDGTFFYLESLEYNTYDNAYYIGNEENPYLVLIKATSYEISSCEINSNTRVVMGSSFYGCESITSMTIPSGVKSIGSGAFMSCYQLERIVIPDTVEILESQVFYFCRSLTKVTLSNNIESISDYLFEGCTQLNNIVIPNSVKIIGNSAFENCKMLTSIVLPENVEIIGHHAFEYCIKLKSVTIPDGVTTIGIGAFAQCQKLETIVIPNSVTSIGKDLFYNCKSLSSLTLPFVGNKRTNATNYNFGFLFGADTFKEHATYIPESLKTVVVTDVKELKQSAFQGCVYLTSITIQGPITIIEDRVFYGCSNVTKIVIPDTVTSLGNQAFEKCYNLVDFTIPSAVNVIEAYVFCDCSSLKNIVIPDGVPGICAYTFSGCKSLTTVTIPEGITFIDEEAFYDCKSLTSISIPENVSKIGRHAFGNCNSVTSITIPDGITSIEDGTFYSCTSLAEITIPSSVKKIKNNIFANCNSLISITYKGTTDEWNEVSKGQNWDQYTGDYIVYCSNGNINK